MKEGKNKERKNKGEEEEEEEEELRKMKEEKKQKNGKTEVKRKITQMSWSKHCQGRLKKKEKIPDLWFYPVLS